MSVIQTIKNIYAMEILDSRGYPTIQTTMMLSDGMKVTSSVPSGTSVGQYEAIEKRDNDKDRYNGYGVLQAVSNINSISTKFMGVNILDQKKIDKMLLELDGTPNKSNLGSNTILSISQTAAAAGAASLDMPLFMYLRQFTTKQDAVYKIPTPIFSILEGGKHATSSLNFQEFSIVGASSMTYKDALSNAVLVYHACMKLLRDRGFPPLVSEEGGFAPEFPTNKDALLFLKQAIESTNKVKYSLDMFLGLSATASSFYNKQGYKLIDKTASYSTDELIEYYESLIAEFSLMHIEDPLSEEDINGWKKLFEKLSDKTLIVGGDFVATNPYRLQTALDNMAVNAVIVKPNQIGTITETIAFVEIAKYKNLKIIVSDRSAETDDDFIADFAVAMGADYVKFGAPARERVIKYNRLLEIEDEIIRYPKEKALSQPPELQAL